MLHYFLSLFSPVTISSSPTFLNFIYLVEKLGHLLHTISYLPDLADGLLVQLVPYLPFNSLYFLQTGS